MVSGTEEALQEYIDEGKALEQDRIIGIIQDVEDEYPDLRVHIGWKKLIKKIQEE